MDAVQATLDTKGTLASISNYQIRQKDQVRPAFELFDLLQIPIEVFAADGKAVFINRSALELNGIQDASLLIGKYNLRKDPVCNDMMGYRELIDRAFRGETVSVPDFKPPVQNLVDRGIIKEKPYESALMEVHFSPVMDSSVLIYVVCIFIVKAIYRGNPKVARAKEYISQNWRGKFEPEATAKYLDMSVTQLYRLFKQHEGIAPGKYHQQCKVKHLKEKLADKNLTAKDAFKACGEDSQGWVLQMYKELTGMTPTEFCKQHSA